MLSVTLFLPLATALLVLALPSGRPRLVRAVALGGALATLAAALALWAGFDQAGPGWQWRATAPWIPALGASYDVAVDGLSLPLVVLTAVLLAAVMLYVLRQADRAKPHAFLLLLLGTGLMGVFAALDLLLFYLFFEVALVPMYFLIGGWGHERRRAAALKFFLYTRAGSLAMLLAFLALALSSEPRTFSLPAIAAAHPLAAGTPAAALAFLGMLLGFGVKLPTIPLHDWLPDAHVEAPTEGSVVLAGLQLKMGAYGFARVLLATLPDTAREYGWLLAALGAASIVYGALAALAQRDLKRLVAYTSVSHMGFVLLGVAAAALTADPAVRELALGGAAYQMVSHGLLTGGMFFAVGLLQDRAGTRELARLGGLMTRMPVYAFLLGLLALGSLGLPGFSGFVAELQVLAAASALSAWLAGVAAVGLVLATAVYLRILTGLLLGPLPEGLPPLADPPPRALAPAGALAGLSLLLGVLPGPLVHLIGRAAALLG